MITTERDDEVVNCRRYRLTTRTDQNGHCGTYSFAAVEAIPLVVRRTHNHSLCSSDLMIYLRMGFGLKLNLNLKSLALNTVKHTIDFGLVYKSDLALLTTE